MAAPNLGELVTTTFQRRRGKTADNVSESNAVLMELKKAGRLEVIDGGRTIVEELDYTEGNFQRYNGFDELDLSEPDIIDAAEYTPQQAAATIVISGRQSRINRGKAQLLNWLASKVKNAERTMANNISSDIYSDGTDTNQINGLQALIANAPGTGTVGGINRANFAFWKNQFLGITPTAALVHTSMDTLWLDTLRGADSVNLITADNTYFKFYLQDLVKNKRYTSDTQANGTFRSLEYNTASVVVDGSSGTPVGMYFLNTDFLKFTVYEGANFELLDARESVNQDANARFIIFMGNLSMSNAARQGRLFTS